MSKVITYPKAIADELNRLLTINAEKSKMNTGPLHERFQGRYLETKHEYYRLFSQNSLTKKNAVNFILTKKMKKTLQEWEQGRKDALPPL